MFYHEIKLGQGLHPSSQDPLWPFKCLKPFQTVMVDPQDDLGSQQVVPEMLERTNHCEQLATSSTIVSLGHVHDPRKNAIGLSMPSTLWDNTAPTATSEASVSRTHGSWGTVKAREVASTRAFFSVSNAS